MTERSTSYSEAARHFVTTVLNITYKDFLLEARSKQAIPLAVALALLIVVVFALTGGTAAQSALWVAFVFAGMLAVLQGVTIERQNNAIEALVVSPVSLSAVYLGKTLANMIFVAVIGTITLGAVVVFLQTPDVIAHLDRYFLVLVLFSLGFASVAVLIALITAMTSISALLMPVLLLPLVVPAIIAGVDYLVTGEVVWILVLLLYDGVMVAAGILLFEELLV